MMQMYCNTPWSFPQKQPIMEVQLRCRHTAANGHLKPHIDGEHLAKKNIHEREASLVALPRLLYHECMKLAISDPTDGLTIHGYEPGEVVINGRRFQRSLVLLPDRVIDDWPPQSFDELDEQDFERLTDLNADLILLGTGQRQAFPAPTLYRSLMERNIGIEIMGTPAACRTYNILMAEERLVAAALIL